jgi:hypothetical protein
MIDKSKVMAKMSFSDNGY